MKTTPTVILLAFVTTLPARGVAQEAAAPAHTMVDPDAVQWGEAPPMLPPGARTAVLYGDPGKEGMFVIRAKLPPGYRIPAHWHPTDETVTVLSGTFMMGTGDKLDIRHAKPLAVGGFVVMPAKTNHFAIASTPAVIQVVAMGPLAFNYVDPKDDPRNGKPSAAK